MKCLIDGCENNVLARGLCGKHYERYRQHGNPLTAKFIPAKPGEPRKFLDDLPIDGEGCVYWPFAKNKKHHHLGTFDTKDDAAAAILDWIAAQIGVTPEELKRGAAA